MYLSNRTLLFQDSCSSLHITDNLRILVPILNIVLLTTMMMIKIGTLNRAYIP